MEVPRERISAIRLPEDTNPVKLEACRAYARMMNNRDHTHIVDWLHDDLQYSSSWVMETMHGKEVCLTYLKGKMETLKRNNSTVWAEIAYTDAFGAGPCVVVAQGTRENLVATMLVTMDGDKISRMCMSVLPEPQECRRTGELPR